MPKLTFKKEDFLRIEEQPLSGSNLQNWFKILKENKFRIDWPFIPKAMYVTAMMLALSPFQFFERRNTNRYIKKTHVSSPVFIIGHFRSGTTFLHYLLGHDPHFAFVSTFETMTPGMIIDHEELFRNIVKNHLPAKRPMDDLEMHANLPYEEEYAIANLSAYSFYLAWYFPRRWKTYFDKYVLFKNSSIGEINAWKKIYDYFLRKISYKNKGKQILLKSPVNTGRIKYLLDLYPDAKFIHIYRNPFHVYLSTWKLYQNILPLFSFQQITSEQLDRNILYSYQQMFKQYFSEKELIPENNLIEFCYEDFIKDPLFFLKKSYDQLNISGFDSAEPFFVDYIERHKNYKASSYTISRKIREKIVDRWGFAFDTFGYERY